MFQLLPLIVSPVAFQFFVPLLSKQRNNFLVLSFVSFVWFLRMVLIVLLLFGVLTRAEVGTPTTHPPINDGSMTQPASFARGGGGQ